jgi:hypothetical protein
MGGPGETRKIWAPQGIFLFTLETTVFWHVKKIIHVH